jgi:hypothetical protein
LIPFTQKELLELALEGLEARQVKDAARLEELRRLTGKSPKRRGRPPGVPTSPQARKHMQAAARKRLKERKRQELEAKRLEHEQELAGASPTKPRAGHRRFSAAARKRMSDAQKARFANKHAASAGA